MRSNELRVIRRNRRKRGIRKRVYGTSEKPRLTVFRSLKHIYAQIIDDDKGVTLAQAGSQNKDLADQMTGGSDVEAAKIVGKVLAERAKAANIEQVHFDRNGYRFHGRVKGLAEAAREAGLKF